MLLFIFPKKQYLKILAKKKSYGIYIFGFNGLLFYFLLFFLIVFVVVCLGLLGYHGTKKVLFIQKNVKINIVTIKQILELVNLPS